MSIQQPDPVYNLSTMTTIDYGNMQLEQVTTLMKALLSGVNDQIQEATKILKIYVKHKESIKTLSFVLAHNPEIGMRQLAAVLLGHNLFNLYEGLTPEQKQEFRNLLLLRFNEQKTLIIQKSIASLIGQLLPAVELANWPELQQLFQMNLAKTPDSPATLILLYGLLYHFKPPPIINSYLYKCLQDPRLVEYALKCLVVIVETQDSIDQELMRIVIEGFEVNHWKDDHIYRVMEILTAMAEKRGKLEPKLISWVCRNIVLNQKHPEKLRICGVDFLFSVSDIQTKMLYKNEQILKEIVQAACLACSEKPREREEDNEPIQEVSLWLIENLTLKLKTKKIFPIMFEAVTALINSNDVHKMNTGYLVLGSMSEGCAERVRKHLPNPIMNTLIPKGLANEAPEVRGAAISALCYFSEFLLPDIIDYHKTIIPSLMSYLNDLSDKVAEKALMALDIYIENLEPEQITQYLPIIVPRLLEILTNAKSTMTMRTVTLNALGSLVLASEEKFQPYLDNVCRVSMEILKVQPSPEWNEVRSANISLQGRLANQFAKPTSAIQKDYFQHMVMPHLETIYAYLTTEQEPLMRQACFSYFYQLANAIGSEFQHIFDKIIVEVLNQCQATIGVGVQKEKAGFSLDSDSDEDRDLDVKLTELDEKAAAIHALGQLAKACPIKFIPHFQAAYQILEEHHQYFYENIRVQVMSCYENITLALIKSKNNNVIPPYKQGIPCVQRYPPELEKHFKEELIPRILFVMTEDDTPQVQACAIETLHNLTKEIGPALVDHSLENITMAIVSLLEGKSADVDDDSEEEEEQEDEETEINTFETLCDLIPRLCKVIRDGFEPCFKQLVPSMMKYTVNRDDVNDYIQIIGSFGQIFKYIPSTVNLIQQELFSNMADLKLINDELLNRNISYCIGNMFEHSPKTMQQHMESGLVTLKEIYEHSLVPATKENAIAAICKMVIAYSPPIPMELFIQNALNNMPFKGDETEERTVLKMLLFLSESRGDLLRPHINRIIELLEHDLPQAKRYKIKEPLLTQLVAFLTRLKTLA